MALGLPKKYIKKYGVSKKAWDEFRKAKKRAAAKRKKSVKKVSKKKSPKKKVSKKKTAPKKQAKKKVSRTPKKKSSPKKGVKKMAKNKKKAGSKSRKSRRVTLLGNRTMNALINGGVIGGAAVGSTWIINMIPMVKDQASWIKALVQAGIGIGGMTFSRQLMVKKLFSGFIAGGAISLILPYMPEGFQFGRSFSNDELRQLQDGRAGRPISMGRPVSFSGRGNRSYAKSGF